MSDNAVWSGTVAPMGMTAEQTKPMTFETAEAVKKVFGESSTQEWLDVTKDLAMLSETKAPWLAPVQPDFTAPVEFDYPVDGLQPEQIEILTAWENTKAQLTKLKEYEMQLRKVIVYDGGFFSADKTSGIERVTLGGGFSLAATKKETYKLDSEKVEEALANFTEDEAKMLVTWVASLSVGNYKKLSEEKKAFFNDCLEIKTGAPTLEIEAPKEKK